MLILSQYHIFESYKKKNQHLQCSYENEVFLLTIADFHFGRYNLSHMISLFPLRLRENRQRKIGVTYFT
jgi:hypothetical protein